MEAEVEDEDLIQREDMVVTVSHSGYIKRVPLSTYRAQRRGGKGRAGMATREEDFVTRIFVANTHTPVLFFSSRGMVYKHEGVAPAGRRAAGARQGAGQPAAARRRARPSPPILPLPEDEASWGKLDVMFATDARQRAAQQALRLHRGQRQNGKIAMKLDEGDRIIGVGVCNEQQRRAADHGGGPVHPLPGRPTCACSRAATSTGVRGIKLGGRRRGHLHGDPAPYRGAACGARGLSAPGEQRCAARQAPKSRTPDDGSRRERQRGGAVSPERYAELGAHEQFVLTVSENGYGKRTSAYEYRISGRGGKGIIAMTVNQRNGKLVASFPVEDSDQIMLVTDGGQLIRCPVDGISIMPAASPRA